MRRSNRRIIISVREGIILNGVILKRTTDCRFRLTKKEMVCMVFLFMKKIQRNYAVLTIFLRFSYSFHGSVIFATNQNFFKKLFDEISRNKTCNATSKIWVKVFNKHIPGNPPLETRNWITKRLSQDKKFQKIWWP